MNETAMKTLEYGKIKEELKSFALSKGAKKIIDELQPSVNIAVIERWSLETTEARRIVETNPSIPLSAAEDLEEILPRVRKNAVLSPMELSRVKDLLESVRRLRRFMSGMESIAPVVSSYTASMYECLELREKIDGSIYLDQVSDRASAQLGRIRKKKILVEGKIKEKITSILTSSNMADMIQEALVSTRGGRYVIPIKKEYKRIFPGTVLDISSSGATVFMEPASVNRLQAEYNLLQAEEEQEIIRILTELSAEVAAQSQEIGIDLEAMVHYDFLFAKGRYSRALNGITARLNNRNIIKIKRGFHPLLGSKAIPLDIELGTGFRALIITGPNTGGKTVALKTLGLLTLMAQSGLHIPAGEDSELAVFTDIRTDIGDGQSIEQSLSTFSAHVKNIADIISCSDPHTLVLMDELGAGTDPGEGRGFAEAVLEEIFRRGATIAATTHISEIKEFARHTEGFENGSMTFDYLTLQPLYQLKIGQPGESMAFLIALRLGIDRSIVERAHEITYKEKKDYSLESVPPIASGDMPAKGHRQLLEKVNTARVRDERSLRQQKTPPAAFQLGDSVYISTMERTGIVCEPVNSRGEVVVMVMKKKFRINHKRLSLHIAAKDLYPEDYDLDIVLESKENRKKRKLMRKRHVEGNVIEMPPEEL